MWRRKQERPAPAYEDVRLVAEVLSRINADLIARHFAVSVNAARQFIGGLLYQGVLATFSPTAGIILLSAKFGVTDWVGKDG
jgi:hypothetical protein